MKSGTTKKEDRVMVLSKEWDGVDERGMEERYMAFRSGGLHPAMEGQGLAGR